MKPAHVTLAASASSIALVTLDQPIVRGETKIESIQIRKPGPGEMRDLKLRQVIEADVESLIVLLPRITIPPLIEQEVAEMDLADFTACANEIAGFLPQKAKSTASPTT